MLTPLLVVRAQVDSHNGKSEGRKSRSTVSLSLNHCIVQIDSGEEELSYTVSELLAAELLSEPHGTAALAALHRFLAYNQEWVGQV